MSWFVQIPEALQQKLRKLREEQKQRHSSIVFDHEDAVILYLGMGPEQYLTLDGRIIIHNQDPFGSVAEAPREAKSLKEIAGALAVGARIHSMPELLELLPAKPDRATTCDTCKGSHYIELNPKQDHWIVCPECD